MRKTLSFLLVVLMLASLFTIGTSAASYRPDLVISKISPDQAQVEGRFWGAGVKASADPFEAFEIVNTSGRPLNLYEYGVFYNGSDKTSPNYGKIWEVTPFLPGSILDGSTLTWENMPTNPDEFVMEIGEVVVVWCVSADSELGKHTMADFRTFWAIPENVRTIAWDGNSSTDRGGHDKNFNLKNSATGTYGIYKISDEIVEEVSLWSDGVSYSQIAYGNGAVPAKTVANAAVIFTFDGKREMTPAAFDENPKFGVLSDAQIEAFGNLLSEYVAPAIDEEALKAEQARKLAMILNLINAPILP